MNDIINKGPSKNPFFKGLGWFTKVNVLKRRVSPFAKGGSRGICGLQRSGLENPPCPPLQKGGVSAVALRKGVVSAVALRKDSECRPIAETWVSPFAKGGARGICGLQCSGLENPPCPPLRKGGVSAVALRKGGVAAVALRKDSEWRPIAETWVSPFVKGGTRGICGFQNSGLDRQRGVALVVALVLLVVVTLVGLAAIRGTTMQQQMTSNFYDREIGFQAAEAGLRTGESWLIANPNNTTLIRDCSDPNNQCFANPFETGAATAGIIQAVPTATFDAGALGAGQPQYVVEKMGICNSGGGGSFAFTNDQNNQGGGNSLVSSGMCYRVTAESNANAAANDRSNVILQSIVRL